MIETREDEDQIVRWAFAEIMSYFRETHKPYWFKFHPSHMKIHKIMYQTFELSKVPVTRSWYRYGCFIHSTQLAGFRDFSILKNRYLRGSLFHPRLESAVANLGFDIESIREALHKTIESMPQKMSIFIKALYKNAPKEFGNIYVSKLGLHNALRKSKKVDFQNLSDFRSWLSRVRKNISLFHMAAFSREQFDDVTEIVLFFTTNLEEALLKIESLIVKGKKIQKKKVGLIHQFSKFFDTYMWLPFALEISAQTVEGVRSAQVRIQQRQKKKAQIAESLDALENQSVMLAETDLILSWREYRNKLSQLLPVSKNV